MTLAHRDPYSYRHDQQVPRFDDGGSVVFMDGTCPLCTRAARLIGRLDHAEEFRICPVQSPLGRAVVSHYGLDPDDPDSWLYLADGEAYGAMDAIIRAGRRLGGWGRMVGVLDVFPRPVRNWLYRRIARNRFSIGGRTDMCAIPDPAVRRRLLT